MFWRFKRSGICFLDIIMKLRRHDFYPVLVIITGLITSQIIFTFVVFRSNIALYSKLSAIRDAGYLIVPNLHIVNTFMEMAPAFYGGLFFSLTAGSGITWVTLLLVLTWISFSYRKIILVLILVFWGVLIIFTNTQGINLPASSALIIIPMVVGYSVYSMFDKKAARV